MMILHITASIHGGAGLAVLRLHTALLSQGIDSNILTADTEDEGTRIYRIEPSRLNQSYSGKTKLGKKIFHKLHKEGFFLSSKEKIEWKLSKIKHKSFFTIPLSIYDLTSNKLIQEADIIHLHWVEGLIDYPTFFRTIHKPIVWTIHDENIGLGGFHYTIERDKYYAEYREIEETCINVKRMALANNAIHFVALSKMMSDYICGIGLARNGNVHTINNGVDIHVFRPMNKSFARSVFKIPQDAKVFIFCAYSLHEKRKGLSQLITALERLEIDNCHLICVGGSDKPITAKFPILQLGYITNENILALLYSAADYFALPSFQEAFCQTSLEALACGTPIVAYPCSGTEELITPTNGIRCVDFSIESLRSGINQLMNKRYCLDEIRQDIVNRFSNDVIARQYIELYETIYNNC